MKILLIGTIESINKIESIIKNENFDLKKVVIDDTDSITNILESIPNDIDGIFASGIGVFNKLVHSYEIDVPVTYAKRGVVSFSKCLLENYDKIKTYRHPSFDCLDKDTLDGLIYDYNINIDSYEIINYDADYGENSYLLNHIDLYKKGKTDCVFTAYGYSYNVLKSIGIPVFRLEACKIDIEDDFKGLVNKINLKTSKDQTFLIHNFHIDAKNSNLRKLINDYASIFEGIVVDQDGETLVISNRGFSLNELEDSLKVFMSKDTNLKVSLASGNTIKEGIDNSMYAKKFISSSQPIVLYNGEAIKFIKDGRSDDVIEVDNKDLYRISVNSGVSLEYIQKICLYTSNKKTSILTSSQLSNSLQVTRRTANRIMNKLVSSEFAKDLMLKDGSKGRPSKAIEILF